MKLNNHTFLLVAGVLAAFVLLSGCPKESADPAAEKGTWQQRQFTGSRSENPADHDYFSSDATTQKITFHFDSSGYADSIAFFTDIDGVDDAGNEVESEKTKAKYFRFSPFTDDSLLGFEAVVTLEKGNATTLWGFDFLDYTDTASNTKSFYTLLVHDNQYMLKYSWYNGTEWTFSTPQGWTSSSAIKTDTNTVKAATRNDGKISISVNGTILKTIMLPSEAFTQGAVSAIGGVHHDDVQKALEAQTNTDIIKVTFKFNRFQQL